MRAVAVKCQCLQVEVLMMVLIGSYSVFVICWLVIRSCSINQDDIGCVLNATGSRMQDI